MLTKAATLQVDKHIRKLDLDLAHFEADLKEKLAHRRSGEYLDSKVDLQNQSLNACVSDKRKKKKNDQPTILV